MLIGGWHGQFAGRNSLNETKSFVICEKVCPPPQDGAAEARAVLILTELRLALVRAELIGFGV